MREQEIFELLGTGYSRREIAKKLALSPRTVDSYLVRLKLNVGAASTRELVRLAMRAKEATAIADFNWIPDEWPVKKRS